MTSLLILSSLLYPLTLLGKSISAGNLPKEKNKVLISKDAQRWISADRMTKTWHTIH